MMKRLVFFLSLAFVAVSIQAQLLWKVSGNGLEKDSYILGTMHNAPASMIDEIPGMQQALEGCDVVIGELDGKDLSLGSLDLGQMMAMLEAPPTAHLINCLHPKNTK